MTRGDSTAPESSVTKHKLKDVSSGVGYAPPASSNTLLPRPLASLITLVAQSTSLSLRFCTYLGGFAINSARATTLTGLELSRAVVENILIRAGRDVVARSSDEYGRNEAESLLERSLATLHTTITSASFFASASFHFSTITLSSFTGFSQNLLSALDAILGSTESSRAIAAIITLIRREFRNPGSRAQREVVGVGDLLVGSIGFVLLQRWGRRKTEREIRENGNEEIIWDVVILDNGLRADVIGSQQTEFDPGAVGSTPMRPSSFLMPEATDEDDTLETIEKNVHSPNPLGLSFPHGSVQKNHQHELSDEDIKLNIMEQLPRGSRAVIRTDEVTARTITVDLYDSGSEALVPPPGTSKIEERFHHNQDVMRNNPSMTEDHIPHHTVIFRTASNHTRNCEVLHPASLMQNSVNDMSKSRPHVFDNLESPQPIHTRRMSSGSSTSDSEMPRGSFGNRTLAKITQGVESKAEEIFGNKTPSKMFPKGVTNSNGIRDDWSNKENPPGNKTGVFSWPRGHFSKTSKDSSISSAKRPGLAGATKKDLPLTLPMAKTVNAKGTLNKIHQTQSSHGHPVSPSLPTCHWPPERNSESSVAQTNAYSLRRRESSPPFIRDHMRNTGSLSKIKSEKDIPMLLNVASRPCTPTMSRRNSLKSAVPSIYSIATGSETSLLLASRPGNSVYEDQAAMTVLSRHGQAPGLFPSDHLVRNIQRFSRFSLASYGSNFLRAMGISKQRQKPDIDQHEHDSFSDYTGLPTSTILLSSFVDPAGGSNSAGETARGFPLVHYLSLDHHSKAAVLTLRGTWGFEDILTDMTCDYDDMHWMGKSFQVHKGMLASARRLLEGGGARVMATIKEALEEFPDYGVIFCGHSLGGGVAALLATLVSQPQDPEMPGPSFVTGSHHSLSNRLPIVDQVAQNIQQQPGQFCLPPGRPVHVYAYGPPALMCPSLRRATRGLITTIVNGQDIVPSLSLGVLHDFHAVSLSFKRDVTDAKSQVKTRIWDAITRSIANKLYMDPPFSIHAGHDIGEDSWAWNTLKSLRKNLTALKLLPPGEVFVVETMRVLQRDAFTRDTAVGDGYPRLGRPATRVQLKYIRDVEARFCELRFGSGMLLDHSPARYEASLAVLARGVLED